MRISDLILYSDQQIIALNKPPGMPTQEDRTGDPSLHRIAQAYCKHDLHVVHRLDRPCSGVVVFAKNAKAAAHLNAQFLDRAVSKQYLAVVPRGLEPAEGTLHDLLTKKSPGKMEVSADADNAVEAELTYRTVGEIEYYALLDIGLPTGRMHQIRVQLSAVGYPVKGDVKYGSRRKNPDRSIHLHAYKVTLTHPTKASLVDMIATPPNETVWNAFDLSGLFVQN